MIIALLILFFIFPMIWFLGFLGHELCHILEWKRQGADDCKIYVKTHKGIPSMSCRCEGNIDNRKLVSYAGGIYSGIVYLLIGLLISPEIYTRAFPVIFSFITLGIVNISYGVYEGKYIHEIPHDKYMEWHYIVYTIALIISIAIMFKPLLYYLSLW